MGIFGGSRESDKKVFGGFGNEYRFKEVGSHPVRFIAGPVRVYQCFIPILTTNNETQEEETKFWPLYRPDKGGVFDILAAIDIKIKRDLGMAKDDIRSVFKSGSPRFAYLGFPRNTGEETVERILAPWTIADELRKKQEQVSGKKKDKLMYGLYFMWDALCEREYDAKKKGAEQNKTSYSLDVDNSENDWAHKVPITWLPSHGGMPENFDPMDSDLLSDKGHQPIFTEIEISAIEEFLQEHSIDEDDHLVSILEKMYAPATDDEVAVFLAENRLDLSAVDNNGDECFPDPEAFFNAVNDRPQLADYSVGAGSNNGKKVIESPDTSFEPDEFEDEETDNKEAEVEEKTKKKSTAKKGSLKDKMKSKKEPEKEETSKVTDDEDMDW